MIHLINTQIIPSRIEQIKVPYAFAEPDAFINNVFNCFSRQVYIADNMLTPCAFACSNKYMIIFLLQHLIDVQCEMEAVISGDGLDLAMGTEGKPPVVSAEKALSAFLVDYLDCRKHDVFYLTVPCNVETVKNLTLFLQLPLDMLSQHLINPRFTIHDNTIRCHTCYTHHSAACSSGPIHIACPYCRP